MLISIKTMEFSLSNMAKTVDTPNEYILYMQTILSFFKTVYFISFRVVI